MFEKFDDRAKEVIADAEVEAKHLNCDSINVEHILLGLLKEPRNDIAGSTLLSFNLALPSVRDFIKNNMPCKAPTTTAGLIFSTSSKKSLEFALREALVLEAPTISPEHILLGMLMTEKQERQKLRIPPLAKIFTEFDVDVRKLETAILEKIPKEEQKKRKDTHPIKKEGSPQRVWALILLGIFISATAGYLQGRRQRAPTTR